ncbi:PAS domain-containing protein [Hymenobacter sp. IS2118]|uniref:PAS domain-containing protein n=1 Tax=Hymenobacter sp. IS2118 TaxID=1505605 RepID=UPI00068F99F0|nr:PAS domain-containing protein [Hymenobacter sp. IS2118]
MKTDPADILFADPATLLRELLAVSPSPVHLLRPRFGPDGPALVDFAVAYLNPAAQRRTGLPERPNISARAHFPEILTNGVFDFYRRVYETGEAGRYELIPPADGLANDSCLAARRAGDLLVVSFSDTADHDRPAAEQALRQSQAAERAARAEAEVQRLRLLNLFAQAPVLMAQLRGPNHFVALANPGYEGVFGHRGIQGRPYREAAPELVAQGFFDLLDRVYQTGETFSATEAPVYVEHANTGTRQLHYYNFIYQATRDAAGAIDGILVVATDVTEPVLSRQQLEAQERHTAQLNQELEARVQARTQEAEATVQRLQRVTESLPSTTFTTDAAGQVLYISPQWHAYTGMAPGTPINEVWPTLIHPDDLPAIAREFGAALAEGRPWGYEFRLRGADGHYRWFASQGVPEPLAAAEAAGRSRQWFGSNLDIHALKQAQQQLEEKDQLLTSILSSIPASVATFKGEDLRFGFFNDMFQRSGQGRAVLGRPAGEVFPEAEAQGFLPLLREVLHTGEPFQAQEVNAHSSDPRTGQQQEMYLDMAYLPLRHGSEPPNAVLVFNVDVTDRVRARQRAEAAQARLLAAAEQAVAQQAAFHRVFEQTPAGIALLREPDHRFEYANPAYQALFPDRPLLGRPMAEVFPETAEQGYLALLDQVYQTSETYFGREVKFTAAPAAGQPPQDTYYDITYQAIREDDRTVGISIFAFDVTERVRARREREIQRQQLESLFREAPAAIAILGGPDFVYELVNPVYVNLLPGRALLGRPIAEVIPELAGTGVVETFEQVYRTGLTNEEKSILVALLNPATGQFEDRYFNYVQQARRDAQGRIDGILLFAFEVTEQVQGRQQALALATELSSANQQLVRTNVDLDNFVYTASHDLKAPIANLDGLLALLRQELPADVAQAPYVAPTLAHMRDAVERFKRTIDQLTDVAKLQKEHDSDLVPVDLAAVIEDVRQDLAPLLKETNAQLTVAVTNFPAILFSEKNLRSVVYNLLSNALKYRHPDRRPHVDVQAHVRADYTVLEVHDNGLGLEAAQLPRLFGMFQRFHSHVEGTGIGLFMVKRMVENAGGRIEVHSQPGAGTTFFVYLPHAPTA